MKQLGFGYAVVLGALILTGATGCREGGTSDGTAPETAPLAEEAVKEAKADPGRQEFAVKGVVRELFLEQKKARIRHEEIPDYMPAMTMIFDVQDRKELEGIKVGDEVAFTMVVTKEDGWIENVRKVGEVTQVVTDVPSNFRLVKDVDPLLEGDPMPNYTFTNEVGRVVNLDQFRGKAVAFTFFFTRCPYPEFCPRMSANMAAIYKGLKDQADGPDNWHLLSITIDPQFDTPSVLKGYALGYDYDASRWNFLTGPLIDITAIAEQFGLQFYRPDPDQPLELSHNLRTVVIDTVGRVHKIVVGNEWDPAEVVTAMVEAARVEAATSDAQP